MESSSIFALSLALISLVISMKYLNLYEKLSDNTKQLSITCGASNLTSPTLLSIQQNLDLNDNDFENTLKNNKESIQNLLKKSTNEIISKTQSSGTLPIKSTTESADNISKNISTSSVSSKTIDNSGDNISNNQTSGKVSNKASANSSKNILKNQTSGKVSTKASKNISKNQSSTSKNQSKKKNIESFENYNYLSIDQRGLSNYNFSDLMYPKNIKDDVSNLDMNTNLDEETKMDKTLQYIYQFHDTKDLPVKINNEFIKKDDIERDGLRYGNRFIKKNWCMVNHDDTNYCFDLYNKKNCFGIGVIVDTLDKCKNKND